VDPSVAEPTAARVSFTVAADGTITGLQAGAFQITELRYGPAGSLKVSPPPLPSVAVVARGPMNMTVVQAALPALSELLYPPPPPPPPPPPAKQPSGKP
jgi:hypothetical protein